MKDQIPHLPLPMTIVCIHCGAWLDKDTWRFGIPPLHAIKGICPKCMKRHIPRRLVWDVVP